MINNMLASLYENCLFDQAFSPILYSMKAYVNLFLIDMLLPSTVLMAVFYFFVKNPFCKWYHWLLIVLVGILITSGLTYNSLKTFLAVPMLNGDDGISGFVSQLVMFNTLFALGLNIILTVVFKQYQGPNKNIPFGGK